jgi:two-component system, OmpR family, sensor kinase
VTLRRRLALAGLAVLVITGLAFGVVAVVQRHQLLAQLDVRVDSMVADTTALVMVANRADQGNQAASALLSEAYVGVLSADGRLRTVSAPSADPSLQPRLLGNERDAGLVTRATASGESSRLRLEVASLGAQRFVVVGLPMDPVEVAMRRLMLTLGVAWLVVAVAALLVGYWVDRLGLRPIARLTEAAAGVTASGGRTPVQVVVAEPRTEAGQLGLAFNDMVATAASGQEQLRRFVADAGHELRTPLTTLQGYSALYAAGGLSSEAEVADAMRRINAEAIRMGRIVEDLLDLASLGDRSTLNLAPVEVTGILHDLAADLKVRDPGRTVSISGLRTCVVLADEERLRQALTALIDNAVKFSPPTGPVRLRTEPYGANIRVSVADRGRGIPAADLPHVFDRFYRVSMPGPPGSGLGLAIVAAIVAAHGGRCGAESPQGAGTTFWVELQSAAPG